VRQRGTRKNPVRVKGQRVSMLVPVSGANASLDDVEGPSVKHAAAASTLSANASFSDLGITSQLVLQLTDAMKLVKPTTCQQMCVPHAVQGKDVLLKSETGSGKTLSFLLPIIHSILALPQRCERSDGTRAIILAPTRELCHQISTVLSKLVAPFRWIVAGSVTGGGTLVVVVLSPGDRQRSRHCVRLWSVASLWCGVVWCGVVRWVQRSGSQKKRDCARA